MQFLCIAKRVAVNEVNSNLIIPGVADILMPDYATKKAPCIICKTPLFRLSYYCSSIFVNIFLEIVVEARKNKSISVFHCQFPLTFVKLK